MYGSRTHQLLFILNHRTHVTEVQERTGPGVGNTFARATGFCARHLSPARARFLTNERVSELGNILVAWAEPFCDTPPFQSVGPLICPETLLSVLSDKGPFVQQVVVPPHCLLHYYGQTEHHLPFSQSGPESFLTVVCLAKDERYSFYEYLPPSMAILQDGQRMGYF
ncbi:hypothetical protein J6590_034543 [Homalodisca vitripennis]|nr:hypothetical protein J6590_034543 [Homalodisca vitripennis]